MIIDPSEDYSLFFIPSKLDDRFFSSDKAAKKLILLHTGRCGSTLLHHSILIEKEMCPPIEIFNKNNLKDIFNERGYIAPMSFADYLLDFYNEILAGVVDAKTSSVFISLTPWQLTGIYINSPEIIEWLFADSIIYVLLRKNIIRQAISYQIASAQAIWHVFGSNNKYKLKNEINTNSLDPINSTLEYIDLIVWAEKSLFEQPINYLLSKSLSLKTLTYESCTADKKTVLYQIKADAGLTSYNINYTKNKLDKLPIKLCKDNNFYKMLFEILPISLPSGFKIDQEFLTARMHMKDLIFGLNSSDIVRLDFYNVTASSKDEQFIKIKYDQFIGSNGELDNDFLTRYSNQVDFLLNYHEKQLLEGGLACDRIATMSKYEKNDIKAVEYWDKGREFLGWLLLHNSNQPDWLLNYHEKQLLEGGLTCDRIATTAKHKKNDIKAVKYWDKGCQFLEALLLHYSNQPDWLLNYHEKQLMEGGLACDRIATTAKHEKNDIKALEYWDKGFQFLETLLLHYSNQPDWLLSYYEKAIAGKKD